MSENETLQTVNYAFIQLLTHTLMYRKCVPGGEADSSLLMCQKHFNIPVLVRILEIIQNLGENKPKSGVSVQTGKNLRRGKSGQETG